MPFVQLGYESFFCDCNLTNLGLNIQHLKHLVKTKKPSLIVICNVLGHSNDYKELLSICNKNKIFLIEDNCESLGSIYKNKLLGSYGFASSHSFYYGHHMSTIEGGMVSTNNNVLKNIMLSVRSHGWGRDLDEKNKNLLQKKFDINDFRNLYTFYYSGFNLRSTDLNAKIGNLQLKSIKKKLLIRHRNYLQYTKELSSYWAQTTDCSIISRFAIATILKNPTETIQFLIKNGIECRPLICGNIIRHPVFQGLKKTQLKNADIVHDYGIYLPNHDKLKISDIKFICSVFKKIAIPFDL